MTKVNAHDLALSLYTMAKNDEDGTISAYGRNAPDMGYWIGGKFDSLIFRDVTDIDRGEIAWFIGTNPAAWYGVWVDQEDGRVYFDGVTHMNYEGNALALGAQRNEVAIWDIERGVEIRVTPSQ